jgi:hypothetical protein
MQKTDAQADVKVFVSCNSILAAAFQPPQED